MFIDLLKKRRSIRRFTDEPLADDQLDSLVFAALLSPSSRNIRPWEIVVVTQNDALQKLSTAKPGAGFLAGAALGLVIMADTRKSDVWVEDCSIVASNLLLAAADLGLGACWAQIRNRSGEDGRSAEDLVREVVSAPAYMGVEAIIGVGHTAEQRPPLTDEDADKTKVHHERFGA